MPFGCFQLPEASISPLCRLYVTSSPTKPARRRRSRHRHVGNGPQTRSRRGAQGVNKHPTNIPTYREFLSDWGAQNREILDLRFERFSPRPGFGIIFRSWPPSACSWRRQAQEIVTRIRCILDGRARSRRREGPLRLLLFSRTAASTQLK